MQHSIRTLISFALVYLIHARFASPIDSSSIPMYECLNGKNPKDLTEKEILIEFSKGKCSPFVIVPGLFTTKLVVEIDCPVLKQEHKDIFNICGWNACSKKFYEFWKKVPRKEYWLWIPDIFGPMSIFQHHEEKNYCWVNIIKLAVNLDKPIEDSVVEPKGFKVKMFGHSEETFNKFECGDGTTKDLMGYEWLEVQESRYLKMFYQFMRDRGYVPGLTYQALPFDFRRSYKANNLALNFKSNIERLSKITGKKVAIIGHSLGNVNVYYQLLQLDNEFKAKYIKVWMPVGSALGGAIQDYNAIIGGDKLFIHFRNKIGVHFHAEIEAYNNIICSFELLPLDPFTYHKDSEWLKAYRNRMLYEQGKVPYEQSGFAFLPKVEDKCSPSNFENFSTSCKLGIYDYSEEYAIRVLQDTFKVNEADKLFQKYNMTVNAARFYNNTRDDMMAKLDNPKVPIVSINLRSGPTPQRYEYDVDVRSYLFNHDFPNPKITYGYGDGELTSTTLFAGPLKWAYEYDQNMEGTYPVKLVDICSTYNIKYNVYDAATTDGEFYMNRNEFLGISCDCIQDQRPYNCMHPLLLADNNVQRVVANTLEVNEISYSKEYVIFVESMDDKELKDMIGLCPQLQEYPASIDTNKLDNGLYDK